MSPRILLAVLSIVLNALGIQSAAFAQGPLPAQVQSKSLRGAESLSLSQAQTMALRQNRDVLQASLEVSKTEANLKSIITTRYPKILAIAYIGQQVNRTGNYPENFVALPGVFEPLTQQYRIDLQVKEATTSMRIAQQRLRLTKQQTVAEVKRDYLSMLALQSAVISFQQNLDFLNELESYTKSQLEKGAALPVDELLVQARVANADFEVDRTKEDLNTLGQTLNRLLGRPPLAQLALEEVPTTPLIEMNENATISEALAKRPELAEVKLDVHRSNLESKIELSRYIPDISFGTAGIFSRNFSTTFPHTFTSIGFLGVWEPWDWGRRLQLSKEADRAMRQARVKLLDLNDTVAISADKARREINVAVKEAKAGALAQTSTEEQLRVVDQRFKVGAALLKDVLEAQAAYTKAISENVKAKTDLATAWVNLDEALGRDF